MLFENLKSRNSQRFEGPHGQFTAGGDNKLQMNSGRDHRPAIGEEDRLPSLISSVLAT